MTGPRFNGHGEKAYHAHNFDASWSCTICGFQLPEKFRPAMSGPVDFVITFVSMDAWYRNMREYEGRDNTTPKTLKLRKTPRLEAPL